MKCLEIIELRSFDNNCQALEKELNDLLNTKPQSIKIYRHSSVPTELRVHILSDCEHAEVNGSPLGILLASAFEEFGIVNHNVWIEKGRREKGARKNKLTFFASPKYLRSRHKMKRIYLKSEG